VVQAIARQARKANTNLRYLHPLAVSLAERLKASLPAHLDTVFFVNSGSEANDLAWRMSVAWTARARPTSTPGALCTAHAYHGISEATVALSPETAASAGHLPAHVERWAPPDAYRSPPSLSNPCPSIGAFSAAIARLEAKGRRLAMSILDGVMQSDGVLQLEPADVQALVTLTHRAGGLWCADEVQGGHGRIGTHMWSFERFGIAPDIVTMGKPMGNGHPVAAVVVRREIAEHFVKKEGVFFSTFGGNPVSCAAAHAVLDVLEDEGVLARTVMAGEALRAQCRRAPADIDCVGDVRGVGLANGKNAPKGNMFAGYDEAQVGPIYDAGDGPYHISGGERVSVSKMQNEVFPAFFENYRALYYDEKRGADSLKYTQLPAVAAGEAFGKSFGAFVLVYRDDDNNAVVVYRGTTSTGDYANIALFGAGWFADRYVQGAQRTWDYSKRSTACGARRRPSAPACSRRSRAASLSSAPTCRSAPLPRRCTSASRPSARRRFQSSGTSPFINCSPTSCSTRSSTTRARCTSRGTRRCAHARAPARPAGCRPRADWRARRVALGARAPLTTCPPRRTPTPRLARAVRRAARWRR
jgi:acetylornithine/succinyldiaminopimelate/putrescine aminotransferase